jgi:hypothetical protein
LTVGAADEPVAEPLPGAWSTLTVGRQLTIVKLAPDGSEAARYSGEVVAVEPDGAWVVVRARWALPTITLDGLCFEPGDQLLEWFSPHHPFNAFALLAPEGALKGWYANVTQPARLDTSQPPPVLTWHDLYVDLVGFPNGRFTMRDDDELRASGLQGRDPRLYQRPFVALPKQP